MKDVLTLALDPLVILRAGGVKRWHAGEELDSQAVSEHSWGVAILVLRFYPAASKELLAAALLHDTPEDVTGDIPAHAKWRSPELRLAAHALELQVHTERGTNVILDASERRALKACDMLEWLIFRQRQRRRGHVDPVLEGNLQKVIDGIGLNGTTEIHNFALEMMKHEREQSEPKADRRHPLQD